MTVMKQKPTKRFDGSGAIDPTVWWKRKGIPNKGFDFSRRTRAIVASHQKAPALPTFVDCYKAADGEGIRRFQRERLDHKPMSSCDGTPDTDLRLRNSHPEYNNKNQGSHKNESKKDDRVENHQVIPSGNTSIGKKGPSLSCSPTRSETNSNFDALLTPDECVIAPSALRAKNRVGKKDKHNNQEIKTSIKKKPILPPMRLNTTNYTSAKNDSKRKNCTEDDHDLVSSKQIAVSPRKKINRFKNCRSINDSDCSPDKSIRSKKKIFKAKKKNTIFKANHKRIRNSNPREATPFVHQKISVGLKTSSKYCADPDHRKRLCNQILPIDKRDNKASLSGSSRKDLDRAKNDEKYGSNYRCDYDDNLQREESQILAALYPTSSPLLTKSNLLALSRQEHTAPNEKPNCAEKFGTDETEEESNVPKTSLLRSETETSTNIMGLSPLHKFRRRAANVDKDFLAEKPKSSSTATNRSMHLCKTTMEIQQDQLFQTPVDGYTSLSSREIEEDSDSKSSLCSERDGNSNNYFPKTGGHEYSSMSPKPKQLLNDFNAVVSVKTRTTSNPGLDEHDQNHPHNSRIAVGKIQDDETLVSHRSVVHNDNSPATTSDEKREEKQNFVKEKKDDSTVYNPSRHTTTILDEMIATALKPKNKTTNSTKQSALEYKQKKANSNKQKRKSDELARKATKKGPDAAFKGNEYSIVRPPKKTKYIFDGDTTSTAKRTRINPRRISLESPPPLHSRQQLDELPTLCHNLKPNCNSRNCLSNEVQQNLTSKNLCYKKRQFGLNYWDNDSSDWSADWDNLSIESTPRHRYHEREDSNQSPNTDTNFTEDSSEDGEEMLSRISKPPTVRVDRDEKIVSKRNDKTCHNQYSNPSDSSRRSFSNGHTTIQTLPIDFSNCCSSLDSSIGVNGILTITHRSISRMLCILCLFTCIRVVNVEHNSLILRNFTTSFGGTARKTKGMRPRIQFTENPNLPLVQASQIHEVTTI